MRQLVYSSGTALHLYHTFQFLLFMALIELPLLDYESPFVIRFYCLAKIKHAQYSLPLICSYSFV